MTISFTKEVGTLVASFVPSAKFYLQLFMLYKMIIDVSLAGNGVASFLYNSQCAVRCSGTVLDEQLFPSTMWLTTPHSAFPSTSTSALNWVLRCLFTTFVYLDRLYYKQKICKTLGWHGFMTLKLLLYEISNAIKFCSKYSEQLPQN